MVALLVATIHSHHNYEHIEKEVYTLYFLAQYSIQGPNTPAGWHRFAYLVTNNAHKSMPKSLGLCFYIF